MAIGFKHYAGSRIQHLVQDAHRGMFAVVLAEALDRISRNQADVATLY